MVDFTFNADVGWHVDNVIIDGVSQGAPPNWSYAVRDDENGSVEVIFVQ